MTLNRPTASIVLTLAAGASALLSGCTSAGNDRTTIGREGHGATVRLSALHGSEPMSPATGPSLTDIYRRDWPEQTFHVPVDGTYHYAHLTSLAPASNGTLARRNGLHPTADSAILDEPRTAPAQEFAASTLLAAADVVMLIPRALIPGLRPEALAYERFQHGGLPTRGFHNDDQPPEHGG